MSNLFVVGECRYCHKNCFWITFVDGILAELEFCSYECMEQGIDEIPEMSKEEMEVLTNE